MGIESRRQLGAGRRLAPLHTPENVRMSYSTATGGRRKSTRNPLGAMPTLAALRIPSCQYAVRLQLRM